MKKYKKGSHTVHKLKAHLILVTRYRYKALTRSVAERIRDILRQICDSNDIEIIQGHVGKDHVHIYISYPPKLSVSEIVKRLKGRSSRRIQDEFPQLGKLYWGKHFWAIGYAAFSSGQITDEMIKEYIKHHMEHPQHKDDDFTVG